MSEATKCECKIEACMIDATECGGSWHTRISSSIGYQLFHFKRCFACKESDFQDEKLLHASDVCREQQYRLTDLQKAHDSLLAEVERLRGEKESDKQEWLALLSGEVDKSNNERFELQRCIADLEARLSRADADLGELAAESSAEIHEQRDRIASLEADNARLTSEQQHCAKCGGVECHALAGLFCGEHSFSGCGEWNGCPICVNARLAGENATVIEARNHLFGRVRALDIETVNQRTHIAQLREQNAALVDAVEDVEKRVKVLFGGMEAGSAIWSNNQYDKGWCAALTAALREIRIAKSALAASGRGK